MIPLQAISIAQSVNLSTGQLDNILVLQLPDGSQVNAVVPENVVDRIYAMANGNEAPAPEEPTKFRPGPASWEAPAPPVQEEPQPMPQFQQGTPPPSEIEWMRLPEEHVPMALKAALTYLNVPQTLTINALNNLIQQVNERFGAEEWAEVQERFPNWDVTAQPQASPQPPIPQPVQSAPQPVPQPTQQPVPTAGLQPAPPVGQVQWADGSPMIPGTVRGRTVPANEKGYPILNDGTVDPGEVVGGGDDVDDDGVGQF